MNELESDSTISEILEFWFGPDDTWSPAYKHQRSLWWYPSAEATAEIRRRFSAPLLACAAGELAAWASSPRGCLAAAVLCHEFPRKLHPGAATAFALDGAGRGFAEAALALPEGTYSDRDLLVSDAAFAGMLDCKAVSVVC